MQHQPLTSTTVRLTNPSFVQPHQPRREDAHPEHHRVEMHSSSASSSSSSSAVSSDVSHEAPVNTAPPAQQEVQITPISMNQLMDEFKASEARFAHLEQVLNGADLVIGLSVLSGVVRTVFAVAMAVWYAAKAAINALISLCKNPQEKADLREFASYELELVKHAGANFLKGVLNIVLPVISNVYAIVNECYLKQRFAYATEATAPTTYALFRSNPVRVEAARHQQKLELVAGVKFPEAAPMLRSSLTGTRVRNGDIV